MQTMWTPKTEADLELAISEGTLSESHFLDAKESTGETDGARKETAKDLASFAIDGGGLIIGIAEDKAAQAFSLHAIPLAGLSEKLEQIAGNRIDPPLTIRVTEIASAGDPSLGYLYVEIPASFQAPHMVGGVYYARGEKTTRRLSDAEVHRLHQRRDTVAINLTDGLDRMIATDPIDAPSRGSRLHFYARPLMAPPEVARKLVRDKNLNTMFQLIQRGEQQLNEDLREAAPTPRSARYMGHRSSGWGASNIDRSANEAPGAWEIDRMIDVLFTEEGELNVSVGGIVRNVGGDTLAIVDALIPAYALRIIHWAAALSDGVGYRGTWGFAFEAAGLDGYLPYSLVRDFDSHQQKYDIPAFRDTTQSHTSELADSPGTVANRLVGKLLRGLNIEDVWAKFIPPTD